jgi:hypothetical protein
MGRAIIYDAANDQMLPREHHRLWIDFDGNRKGLEYMSADFWRQNEWGPFAPKQDRHLEVLFPDAGTKDLRAARLAEFMDAAFDRGGRFMEALDRHPETPPPVPLILFAADASSTLTMAAVTRSKKGLIALSFKGKKALDSPGDGRVPRFSVLADERTAIGGHGWLQSPISWSQAIFLTDAHTLIFGNPTFQNNLLHLLLDGPPATHDLED